MPASCQPVSVIRNTLAPGQAVLPGSHDGPGNTAQPARHTGSAAIVTPVSTRMASALHGGASPGATTRVVVVVGPGEARRYDAAEWRDAIVTVGGGAIDAEPERGAPVRFVAGDVVALGEERGH